MHITRTRARPAPRRARLLDQHVTVLDAYGDFGHAVVEGELWIIRNARTVMHGGDVVRVVEDRGDYLLVLGTGQGAES